MDYFIDNNDNTFNIFEKLKPIIKKSDQSEFFELVEKYKSEHSKLKNIKILKENPKLDPYTFRNDNRRNKIHIFNSFFYSRIKGCGFWCLTAFKLLLRKSYNIEELINSFDHATFQIEVLKILCNDIIKDENKIFLINEEISKNEYIIYSKKIIE